MADYDERPWGWGVCCHCGEDCDNEWDYDPATGRSTHQHCEANGEPERLPDYLQLDPIKVA